MQKSFETVDMTFDESTGVGTVKLNRPDALNAISSQLRSDVIAALELLEEQNDGADGVALRAVVIEGAGDRAFSAGADITEFSGGSSGGSSERSYYRFIREFPAPVIAKIQGYCLGGGFETALSCDFRIASDDSTFGFPEIDLGLLPGAGGSQMVAALAGPAVAKELSMTGKHVPADIADDEGLVNEVHPADELDDTVAEIAEDLAAQAPLAIQRIKASVNLSREIGLEEGIDYDGQAFAVLLNTEDAREGTSAFAEDREPEFEGR